MSKADSPPPAPPPSPSPAPAAAGAGAALSPPLDAGSAAGSLWEDDAPPQALRPIARANPNSVFRMARRYRMCRRTSTPRQTALWSAMRHTLTLIAALLVALTMAACGQDEPPAAESAAPSTSGEAQQGEAARDEPQEEATEEEATEAEAAAAEPEAPAALDELDPARQGADTAAGPAAPGGGTPSAFDIEE